MSKLLVSFKHIYYKRNDFIRFLTERCWKQNTYAHMYTLMISYFCFDQSWLDARNIYFFFHFFLSLWFYHNELTYKD